MLEKSATQHQFLYTPKSVKASVSSLGIYEIYLDLRIKIKFTNNLFQFDLSNQNCFHYITAY